MELLKLAKRRSRLSEAAHIALNVGLAIAVLLIVLSTESIWLPVSLVIVSKWRVLAVRPRYWFVNIMSNMVDLILGVSLVVLLYAATGAIWVQILITLLHIAWLVFIKPRSKRSFVVAQALIASFFGINALALLAHEAGALVMVLGMWVIGYVATRHVLVSYSDSLTPYLSLVNGLFYAELGWLSYHWLFAYTLPNTGNIKIAQVAIIATVIGFVSERVYTAYYHNQRLRAQDIVLPVAFGVALIVIILLFFNQISAAGSL